MLKIKCLTCDAKFTLTRKIRVGEKVTCPDCGEQLRVRSLNPLSLEYWEEDRSFEEKYSEEIMESQKGYLPDDDSEYELPDSSRFEDDDDDYYGMDDDNY